MARQTYLQHELLVNVALCNAGLKVWVLQKTQEKFVDELVEKQIIVIIKNSVIRPPHYLEFLMEIINDCRIYITNYDPKTPKFSSAVAKHRYVTCM